MPEPGLSRGGGWLCEEFLGMVKLEKYTAAFTRAGVRVDALKHMTDTQLTALVPHSGSRALIQVALGRWSMDEEVLYFSRDARGGCRSLSLQSGLGVGSV